MQLLQESGRGKHLQYKHVYSRPGLFDKASMLGWAVHVDQIGTVCMPVS